MLRQRQVCRGVLFVRDDFRNERQRYLHCGFGDDLPLDHKCASVGEVEIGAGALVAALAAQEGQLHSSPLSPGSSASVALRCGLVNVFLHSSPGLAGPHGRDPGARVEYGRDPHHIAEAEYKAIARALRAAVEPDPRVGGIPSTKGVL